LIIEAVDFDFFDSAKAVSAENSNIEASDFVVQKFQVRCFPVGVSNG
jgi:hypothetical protein